MSCENFEVEIKIIEATFKIVKPEHDEDEKTPASLTEDSVRFELSMMGEKVEASNDEKNSIIFRDGCHVLDLGFKFEKSSETLTNKEFSFDALGNVVFVNLVKIPKLTNRKSIDTRKSMKKLKDDKQNPTILAKGYIDLLRELKRYTDYQFDICHINLYALNNPSVEVCVQYQILFRNPPSVDQILSIGLSIHNLSIEPEESLEVAFHFPFDENHPKAVKMHKEPIDLSDCGFLVDEYLKTVPEDVNPVGPASTFVYENFQTPGGFETLAELITSERQLLVEFQWQKNVFMAFVNLRVFNYEGVDEAVFLVPAYHRNEIYIRELYEQDLSAFPDEKQPGKKRNSKLGEVLDDKIPAPLIVDEKHVVLLVRIKIAQPPIHETSLEDLKSALNEKFEFLENTSEKDRATAHSEEFFRKVVRKMYKKIEKVVDDSSDLNIYETEEKIKKMISDGDLVDRKRLRESVSDLIGNKYNGARKTSSNHEFKVLMIDVYKEINREILKIIACRKFEKSKAPFEPFETNFRRRQVGEWLELGHIGRAAEILDAHLINELDPLSYNTHLAEQIAFYFKLEKQNVCESKIRAFITNDDNDTFGFYALAYLMLHEGRLNVAILCLKILVKLQAFNMEYWILLMMIYDQIELKPGVDFCTINIHKSRFRMSRIDHFVNLHMLEFKSDDNLANILNHQMRFNLRHFYSLTKAYADKMSQINQNSFEYHKLKFTEAFWKRDLDSAGEVLRNMEITDENEAASRIMKGNYFFDTGAICRAIYEYEVAYHLSLKARVAFPHLLTIRLGDFFLNQNNLEKARRFFHHSCRFSPSFASWMGLGTVCYFETNYRHAERYFAIANKIYSKSGDNWIYLAMTNHKLSRPLHFKKCLLYAKRYPTRYTNLCEEAERIAEVTRFSVSL